MHRRLLFRAAMVAPVLLINPGAHAQTRRRFGGRRADGILIGTLAVVGGLAGWGWWRAKAARAAAERQEQVAAARLRAAERRAADKPRQG
jgi:hypothetical protein